MTDGRKPVPAEIRRQRGKPGPVLPAVIGGRVAPEMPAGLTKAQQQAWTQIVTDLAAAEVIDHADAAIIESAAVHLGRAREARALVNVEGLIAQSSQGRVRNPALTIEESAWKEFRLIAENLPLSPVGRTRLGLRSKPPADQVERDIGLSPRQKLRVVGETGGS